VGAIQVPDGGEPIVIMQDGPTIGGYPKIAVIRSAWISRFAQLAPGERVRFAIDE
jgi:allophanate hydrolase